MYMVIPCTCSLRNPGLKGACAKNNHQLVIFAGLWGKGFTGACARYISMIAE